MEPENISVEFVSEWGDWLPGEKRSLPAPFARHMVDSGVCRFIEESAPAVADEPPVERAVKRVGK